MKRIKICLLSLVLVAAAGCTGDFVEMNTNPISPTSVEPELMFMRMVRFWNDDYQLNYSLYSNQYAQYISCTKPGWITDRYGFNSGWIVAGWDKYYLKTVNILKVMEETWGDDPQHSNMLNIGRISKIFNAQMVTDYWGDIPYFEAGKGEDKLAYDTQESIYKSFFKDLTDAQNALTASSDQASYGKYDYVYAGDPMKWKRFANTLRLRMALRISNIDPALAKSEGEAAIRDGVFTSADDNAQWSSDQDKDDFGGFQLINISFWGEFRMSSTIEAVYKQVSSVVDPRMAAAWHPTANDPTVWKGLDNGLTEDKLIDVNDNNSNIGGTFFTSTTPNLVMGYTEACFLLAEAAWLGWAGAGDAKTHYENGIKASFAYYGIAPEDYEAYMKGGDVPFSSDRSKQYEQIITQKYLGIFPDGVEAWAEFRRTGLPKYLKPVADPYPGTVTPGEFIKKIRYVDNEYEYNADNVNNPAINGGQGDGPNVRVWWDTGKYK